MRLTRRLDDAHRLPPVCRRRPPNRRGPASCSSGDRPRGLRGIAPLGEAPRAPRPSDERRNAFLTLVPACRRRAPRSHGRCRRWYRSRPRTLGHLDAARLEPSPRVPAMKRQNFSISTTRSTSEGEAASAFVPRRVPFAPDRWPSRRRRRTCACTGTGPHGRHPHRHMLGPIPGVRRTRRGPEGPLRLRVSY